MASADGLLKVGNSNVITLTATAPAAAASPCPINTATVLGNEAETSLANNSSSLTTCVVTGAITVAKIGTPASVSAAGQVITYTFL